MEESEIATGGMGLFKSTTWGELKGYTWGDLKKMTSSASHGAPLCILCFREALRYMKSSDILFEKSVESELEIDKSIEEYPLSVNVEIPGFVMLVLSCELFIKSMLHLNGTKAKGHRLDRLFNELDDESKSEITEIMGDEAAFASNLEKFSRSFVDVRYSYENDAEIIDTEFAKSFSYALKDVAAKRINDSM